MWKEVRTDFMHRQKQQQQRKEKARKRYQIEKNSLSRFKRKTYSKRVTTGTRKRKSFASEVEHDEAKEPTVEVVETADVRSKGSEVESLDLRYCGMYFLVLITKTVCY